MAPVMDFKRLLVGGRQRGPGRGGPQPGVPDLAGFPRDFRPLASAFVLRNSAARVCFPLSLRGNPSRTAVRFVGWRSDSTCRAAACSASGCTGTVLVPGPVLRRCFAVLLLAAIQQVLLADSASATSSALTASGTSTSW